MAVNDPILMPSPKKMIIAERSYRLPKAGFIVLVAPQAAELVGAAQRIAREAGRDWRITASTAGDPGRNVVRLQCDPKLKMDEQGYALDITPQGIDIKAAAPVGIFYGACTLCQLLAQYPAEIPLVSIKDKPDFPVRGVMLDISRDKVPTLETLMELTDLLAGWKINQFQLYTEHTFAYRAHEVVWKKASPITGEDIFALDKYCAERFIELVPNQNSFGHMERWLKHKEYKHLAEAPNGFDFPWGHNEGPFSLYPGDPGSLELVRGLYDELLPHFTSRQFNVGCDETFDLGQGKSKEACEKRGAGRVYLDFLLNIYKEVKKRDHVMQFWGDIIIKHPELIDELPKDTIALEWGYEADHPFKDHTQKFAKAGVPFWVCPGTSAWDSLVGRTNNAVGNLSNAAVNGFKAGSTGFLNTDWGDFGHFQHLPVSYLGFLYGAGVSWNTATKADDLPMALSLHAFRDPTGTTGRVAYDLGNVYELLAKRTGNSTPIWRQLIKPLKDMTVVDGISVDEFEKVIEATKSVKPGLRAAKINRPDADIIKREIINGAEMTALASRIGQIRLENIAGRDVSARKRAAHKELERLIGEYETLWLTRNRPGGLPDSRKRLENLLKQLQA